MTLLRKVILVTLPDKSSLKRALSRRLDRVSHFTYLTPRTDAPDYYDIVKNPMSWILVQEKLDNVKYVAIQDLKVGQSDALSFPE